MGRRTDSSLGWLDFLVVIPDIAFFVLLVLQAMGCIDWGAWITIPAFFSAFAIFVGRIAIWSDTRS